MTDTESKESANYIGRTARIFISYSTEDKEIAGRLKKELEFFGFEVFLAHEDIEPSSEWQTVILDNLRSADIFIPLITESFQQSKWTDQESGIAFIGEKIIIPIVVNDCLPYGFIARFQALKLSDTTTGDEIIKAVVRVQPKIKKALLDTIIKAFGNSHSWEAAGRRVEILSEFDTFSKEQMNEIVKSTIENGQINESFRARPLLNKLFTANKHLIEENSIQLLQEREVMNT